METTEVMRVKMNESFSKLTPKKREIKIKSGKTRLQKYETNNKKYEDEITRLRHMIRPTYELERELNLLTHIYSVKDWVVVKSRNFPNKYEIRQIKALIGSKMYILYGYYGLKGAYVEEKVYEKDIVGHVNSLEPIGTIRVCSRGIQGNQAQKCNKRFIYWFCDLKRGHKGRHKSKTRDCEHD